MANGYRVAAFGGPEVMVWESIDLGDLAPGEVRVRVGASGINFAETRMRAGDYSGQELPFVMGMEVAGTVEEVGAAVTGFNEGDRVFGRVRGAHAEVVEVLRGSAHAVLLPAHALDVGLGGGAAHAASASYLIDVTVPAARVVGAGGLLRGGRHMSRACLACRSIAEPLSL